MIAERIGRVGMSATLHMSTAAKRMRADGIDIVDLSVGEPVFATPSHIGEAAKKAIDDGHTTYTMNPGIQQLREAICQKYRTENGLEYEPSEIIVSTGAKQCLFNACMALLAAGDEAIIPAPYWVSYPAMVNLAGAKPVYVSAGEESGFRLSADALRTALTPKSKMLFINNPCNPTGASYSRDELEAIAQVAVEADLVVVTDEIYEKLVYDGHEFVSFASLGDEVRNRTVVISGVSKAYSMTGWRIGYAAAPKEVIKAMSVVQSHSTSNASSISQWASLAGLTGPQDGIDAMVDEFWKRRAFVLKALTEIPGWSCVKPQGAFYTFPNVGASLGTRLGDREIGSDMDLSQYLLEEGHVATVPGGAFGAPGFIRISYAASLDRLEEGLKRIKAAVAGLKR